MFKAHHPIDPADARLDRHLRRRSIRSLHRFRAAGIPAAGKRQPRDARRQARRLGADGPAVHGRDVFLAEAVGGHLRHGPTGLKAAEATSGRRARQLQTNVVNNAKALRDCGQARRRCARAGGPGLCLRERRRPAHQPRRRRASRSPASPRPRAMPAETRSGRLSRSSSSRRSGGYSARPGSTCSC
jgi:hypothetical protein